ncbi:alpha/beta hydrolase-fold protein [Streptomyces sp. NPDC001941]|uniref:alpha/beta hydrolase n=1 Tax=Streptomyces sp. NPDC001941 TaxID=3154659 RepID=UPI0033202E02
MGLTSTSFFVALNVVCVLAVLGTLVFWGRIPGPSWVRWPARLALILVCQFAAIAATATWINNQYGLYASWNDLLGTDSFTDDASLPGVPAKKAKFTRSANGVLSTQFRGSASKLSGQVIVWTPPEYEQAKDKKKFPVILLLHGVPGGPQSYLEQGGIPDDFSDLVARGVTHPFVLVMPVVNPGNVNTDCSDVPGHKVATWLAKDVPDLVRTHFRTLPDAKAWGVMGFSTGGYCAAKLPLQYPDVFGAGAALDPDPLDGEPDILPDKALRDRNTPTLLVRNSRADVGIFLATSLQDRDSPRSAIDAFEKAAAGSSVKVKTLIRPTGGHNYQTWTGMYPDAFGFLGSELRPPG